MKKQAYPILVVVLAMWLVWLVDLAIPADLRRLGLVPRSLQGLPGIGLMPFLHANLGHLVANTIPLVILLGLTVASRPRAWGAIVAILIGSGLLLWLFGRSAYHIGASGWVFGMIAYLLGVGVREKRLVSVAVALLVGLLFGATLLSGIVPRIGSAVSWDGHLAGVLSGLLVALASSRVRAS